jgi:hypothetical protein
MEQTFLPQFVQHGYIGSFFGRLFDFLKRGCKINKRMILLVYDELIIYDWNDKHETILKFSRDRCYVSHPSKYCGWHDSIASIIFDEVKMLEIFKHGLSCSEDEIKTRLNDFFGIERGYQRHITILDEKLKARQIKFELTPLKDYVFTPLVFVFKNAKLFFSQGICSNPDRWSCNCELGNKKFEPEKYDDVVDLIANLDKMIADERQQSLDQRTEANCKILRSFLSLKIYHNSGMIYIEGHSVMGEIPAYDAVHLSELCNTNWNRIVTFQKFTFRYIDITTPSDKHALGFLQRQFGEKNIHLEFCSQ